MGFEQKVPPIPNRQQQKQAITRLENSWLGQSYYKYYMNEAVRQSKMAFSDRLNKTRSDFFFNLALYGVILLPVTFMARRFFVSRGGLPITMTPNYFGKIRTDNQVKNAKFNKFSTLFYLSSTIFCAYIATDWEATLDRNYEYIAKPVRYL